MKFELLGEGINIDICNWTDIYAYTYESFEKKNINL